MFKMIRRILLLVLVGVLFIVGIVTFFGYQEYKEAIKETPIVEKAKTLQNSDNYVQLEHISEDFLNAVVAIEDRRFYSHSGIDVISLVRVTLANLVAQDIVGGGSTITQQVAKNFYFMESNSFVRKVSEAFSAKDIEKEFDKDEILEMYVNMIYYGDGYYGIYEASMGYFNVPPAQLTLAQASMLAGLPQSPSRFALSNQNEASYHRQQDVLNTMLENEYITKEQYTKALEDKLK